jgi:hypothetical protein
MPLQPHQGVGHGLRDRLRGPLDRGFRPGPVTIRHGRVNPCGVKQAFGWFDGADLPSPSSHGSQSDNFIAAFPVLESVQPALTA